MGGDVPDRARRPKPRHCRFVARDNLSREIDRVSPHGPDERSRQTEPDDRRPPTPLDRQRGAAQEGNCARQTSRAVGAPTSQATISKQRPIVLDFVDAEHREPLLIGALSDHDDTVDVHVPVRIRREHELASHDCEHPRRPTPAPSERPSFPLRNGMRRSAQVNCGNLSRSLRSGLGARRRAACLSKTMRMARYAPSSQRQKQTRPRHDPTQAEAAKASAVAEAAGLAGRRRALRSRAAETVAVGGKGDVKPRERVMAPGAYPESASKTLDGRCAQRHCCPARRRSGSLRRHDDERTNFESIFVVINDNVGDGALGDDANNVVRARTRVSGDDNCRAPAASARSREHEAQLVDVAADDNTRLDEFLDRRLRRCMRGDPQP